MFKSSTHFLIRLFVFLVLSCMSYLYILKVNPLSVVSFAIIFSHSEDYLFPLFIVSFAVKQLLSLIRSHLFIFVFNFCYSTVQSLICVRLFETPWTAAHQASLSIVNSQSLLKLTSIESVMPSNLLILCCSLPLLPSVFPSIRVFSSESVLHIRWPKYRSFSFSINLSNEYSRLISFRIDWLNLLAV